VLQSEWVHVKEKDVETRPVEGLRGSDFNPSSRHEPKALRTLKASIARRGIVMPLLITEDGRVVDGHRRLACARELGIADVPVVVCEDDGELYGELNDSTRRMTSREWLAAYMRGQAPAGFSKRMIEGLEELGGKALLEQIASAGLSPSLLKEAQMVAKYIGCREDADVLRQVVRWMVEGHRQQMGHNAVQHRCSPERLYTAVMKNRDIRETWG
jgi:hypothetical protein